MSSGWISGLAIWSCIVSSLTVSGLMPLQCLTNLTAITTSNDLSEIECCPIPKGHQNPCGFPRRGICQRYQQHHLTRIPPYPFNTDIRQEWPRRLVQRMCHCHLPFHGADCGECWYGLSGPRCDQRITLTRRDITSYSVKDKDLFRNVMLRMRDKPSNMVILMENVPEGLSSDARSLHSPGEWVPASMHEALVFIHYFSQRPLLTHNVEFCHRMLKWKHLSDYSHQGPGFMTWHRHFINLWERWAQQVALEDFGVANFTFPFWDWTEKRECDVCTDDLLGRTSTPSTPLRDDKLGVGSPFRDWTVFCSDTEPRLDCAPCHQGIPNTPLTRIWRHLKFPSFVEVLSTLNQRHYDFYDDFDKQVFYRPELSSVLNNSPSARCKHLASRLEGMCPNEDGSSEEEEESLYMHNRLHNMCKGAFLYGRTSPNDPIFVLHHTQMDRVFQTWIRRYDVDASEMPAEEWHVGQCRDCPMVGFFPPPTHAQMFADSRELGYDYEHYRFGDVDLENLLMP